MTTEQLYEHIEAYLSGTLQEEQLRAFEEELRTNPELAREVDMHRQLEATLSDKSYVHFRKELDSVANAYRASEKRSVQAKKSANKWLIALTIFTLLLIALWWIFKSKNNQDQPILPEEKVIVPLGTQDTMQSAIPQSDSSYIPSSPSSPPKHVTPKSTPYDPNPELELAITAGAGNYFKLSQTTLDAPKGETPKTVDISFHSRVQTALDSLSFQLHILSNKPTSNNPLYRLSVDIILLKEDAPIRAFAAKKSYRLSTIQTVELAQGLFYVRLYDSKTQEYFWTGKFSVEK